MSADSIKTILSRLEKISDQVRKLEEHIDYDRKAHEERIGEVLQLARDAIELFKPVKAVVDDLRTRVTKLENAANGDTK